MQRTRERTLDYLRALAICQVVFVHILYWSNIFETGLAAIVKSFFLFEMPIFFFVTGAVNSVGHYRSYFSFCAKRIKGLFVPYYIYAVQCVVIGILYFFLHHTCTAKNIFSLILSWLFPIRSPTMPLPFFSGTIWFVSVYFFSILLFPLLKAMVTKIKDWAVVVLAFSFLLIDTAGIGIGKYLDFGNPSSSLFFWTFYDLLQKTSFYLIFVGLGILYPSLKANRHKYSVLSCISFLVSVLGIILFYFLLGNTLDMQQNKFPPNRMFLLYSLGALSLLYFIMPFLKKLYLRLTQKVHFLDRMICLFSRFSFYVCLYESYAFLIMRFVLTKIGLTNDFLIFAISIIPIYCMIWLTLQVIQWLQSLRRIHTTFEKH